MGKKRTKRDKKGKFAGSYPVLAVPPTPAEPAMSGRVAQASRAWSASLASHRERITPLPEEESYMGVTYKVIDVRGRHADVQVWSEAREQWLDFSVPVSADTTIATCREAITSWLGDSLAAARTAPPLFRQS